VTHRYLYSSFTFGKNIRKLGKIEQIKKALDPLFERISKMRET
jgi:hypothetical protein